MKKDKEIEKRFDELMFCDCPTRTKFFWWCWTKEGKEILIDFVLSEIKRANHNIKEEK